MPYTLSDVKVAASQYATQSGTVARRKIIERILNWARILMPVKLLPQAVLSMKDARLL